MSSPNAAAQQVVADLLDRFPESPTTTLAKKAFRENGALWPTFNACYLQFRRLRGNQGAQNRRLCKKDRHRPNGQSGTSFPSLPEGIKHLDDWEAVQCDNPGNWLVMSDLHVPYHEAGSIRLVWKEARRRKVTGILLNGDVADCFAVSRWEKDPRKRDFPSEVETLRKFFAAIRSAFPAARIVWKFGNHELRYVSYMQVKAPDFLGIADFDFAKVTQADQHGVETVTENQPVKLGKLWTIHGHEYRFAIANPVNPARGLFLKSKVSALCGHFHQAASHTEKNMAEHITTCWSTGCLCDMRPDYMPLNQWNQGAAFVEVSGDGAFSVENKRIIDGKLWS